jgi:plastocyanin
MKQKRNWKRIIQYLLLPVYIIVIFAVFIPHFFLHTPQYVQKNQIVACSKSLHTYEVDISESGFSPTVFTLPVCSTITFKNTGTKFHQVAFGDHPTHLLYPFYVEQVLSPNKKISLLLTAFGTYKIHDHLHEELEGELIITK